MKFKLLIECTKDIDELSINFSDGTSIVKETKPKETPRIPKNPKEPNKVHEQTKRRKEPDDPNWFNEVSDVDTLSVSLPKIETPKRESVKIAQELQNLNI